MFICDICFICAKRRKRKREKVCVSQPYVFVSACVRAYVCRAVVLL